MVTAKLATGIVGLGGFPVNMEQGDPLLISGGEQQGAVLLVPDREDLVEVFQRYLAGHHSGYPTGGGDGCRKKG